MQRAKFALLFLFISCTQLAGKPNPTEPETAAKEWADKLKLPVLGASCTSVDSDGDGYVSCVLAINTGDQPRRYQGLQCAELNTTKAGGCKPDNSITLPSY
jgi:hypothetical protein